MKPIFDSTIQEILNQRLAKIEKHFNADVLFYYGLIIDGLDKAIRDLIEDLKKEAEKKDILCIILNTNGGSAEAVERIVNIIRHHYKEVYFIVPDAAYSAGTVFCMSGDKIYMDYSSSLGPIDPQVPINDGKDWVPALGYLDKVDEMIKKPMLSEAELVMLKSQDLAMLRSFEQAKELTIALLKEWLVKYKFKTWTIHETTPALKDQPVTPEQKIQRAEEIAAILGDNKRWHSHGRSIGVQVLTKILKLKIDDYSNDSVLRPIIVEYNELMIQYILRNQVKMFFHTRKFI